MIKPNVLIDQLLFTKNVKFYIFKESKLYVHRIFYMYTVNAKNTCREEILKKKSTYF